MTKKQGAFLSIILIAIVIFWLNNDKKNDASEVASQPASAISTNDYTIESFSLVQYDENGDPLHSISAKAATINKQETGLTQPNITTKTPEGEWQLSALKAVSSNNFQSLQLQKNVRIEKKMIDLNLTKNALLDKTFLVSTPELNYSVENKQITSSKDITYQDGLMVLTGTGLMANLVEEEFKILSNVSGIRRAK